jgi:Flp pilus assembly protein TadD
LDRLGDNLVLRIGLISAVFAGLALGGCQTGADSVNVFPTGTPSLEGSNVMSNDPSRLGRTHLGAGNYAMAARNFQEAVEKNRADAGSWLGLAAAYDLLGRFDLADRAYTQAAKLQGETLELINNRGYSYLLRGDGARAYEQFQRSLALDPGNAVIANNVKLLELGQRHVRTNPL